MKDGVHNFSRKNILHPSYGTPGATPALIYCNWCQASILIMVLCILPKYDFFIRKNRPLNTLTLKWWYFLLIFFIYLPNFFVFQLDTPYNKTTCSRRAYSRGKGQKIIGFSYYGDSRSLHHQRKKYFEGIQNNLKLLQKFYPGKGVFHKPHGQDLDHFLSSISRGQPWTFTIPHNMSMWTCLNHHPF